MRDELLNLEKSGWRALSSEGDAGRLFYADLLRDDAVMLFPGGLRLSGKAQILESLAAQPWADFNIEKPEVILVSDDTRVLTYIVKAQREGAPPYTALVSSTYTCTRADATSGTGATDGWQLVVHQHTPV